MAAQMSNLTSSVYVSNIGTQTDSVALLIVDPQNDFHSKGSLAVPGADADSDRLAQFIRDNIDSLDDIYVTLDTHMRYHIAHKLFWVDKSGKHPEDFTTITQKDVQSGKWKTSRKEMEKWGLEYVRRLEQGKRFQLTIWPDHCLIGTDGHNVYGPLAKAIEAWETKKKTSAYYIIKGNNSKTEHYSALKAEVVLDDDPKTGLNHNFLSDLKKHQTIFIAGQALSHCVNYTVRDLVDHWDSKNMKNLVIFQNGSSSVSGFEADGKKFVQDMGDKGCEISKLPIKL